ncbi:hypothetical protein [Chthonobacter rhizosphaerae]|uniref:hypothetical protein n=1 Tax=Chthonobacter rhizosphaerae TaxID=2735553 RepID=UPI0015EE6BD7|nr:hypothetical protein [Chthonobacter rhizosphaerae]
MSLIRFKESFKSHEGSDSTTSQIGLLAPGPQRRIRLIGVPTAALFPPAYPGGGNLILGRLISHAQAATRAESCEEEIDRSA